MTEEWKEIAGYEGDYLISSYGRIKSIKGANSKRVFSQFGAERIMTPINNGRGYLYITLSRNNSRKNHYLHRLVADAFVHKPDGMNYVNHIDYDKTNNHADNLEWCTQKENIMHSLPNMIHKPHKGIANNTSGERYIRKRRGSYEVAIRYLRINKSFTSLEKAIGFRDEAIRMGVVNE